MKTFEEFLQNYYSNITDKNSNVNEVVNISDNVEPMDNNDNKMLLNIFLVILFYLQMKRIYQTAK